MELELFINNVWERMESDKETNSLSLSYTEDSLTSPSDYFSDFSYPFKLPKTSRNNTLLNHVGELDSNTDKTVYRYRLHGENDEPISEGNAVVTSATLKDYTLQLNGSLGIAFNRLLKSGFAESDEPDFFQFPDIINYDGSTYTAVEKMQRGLVFSSWNVDSATIPFELTEILQRYGSLKNYYGITSNDVTEQDVFISSFFGFMPQFQGRYKEFDSAKWLTYEANRYNVLPLFSHLTDTDATDVGDGATEYQMQQFRSYYQQSFVYVQKLWELYKQNFAAITGYTLNLDSRWYNENNLLLRDCVYTLQNFGNADTNNREEVLTTNTVTATNNLNLPDNSQFDPDTMTLYNLSTNVWMSFYTSLETVKPAEMLELNLTFPISFQCSENSPLYRATRAESMCAFNQKNPLYIVWSVVDSSYNTIYTSPRPIVVLPLVKTPSFSEEWDAPDREVTERLSDVIICNYAPQWMDSNKRTGFITSANVRVKWFNNTNIAQNCRLRFKVAFANNAIPFRQYFPSETEQANAFAPVGEGWGDSGYTDPPRFPSDSFAAWKITDATAITTVSRPLNRSFAHLKTWQFFGDEKPFNILLKYSKLNNLVWKVDEYAKTVSVLRRNDFLDDCINGGFFDLTDKINVEKGVTIETQTFNADKVLFEFSDGQTKYAKEYKDKYGTTYGSLTIYTGQNAGGEPIKAFKSENTTYLSPIVATDIIQPSKGLQTMNEQRYETPVAFPANATDKNDYAGEKGVFYLRCQNIPVNGDVFKVYENANGVECAYITDDTPTEIQYNTYVFHDREAALKTETTVFPQFFSYTRDFATQLIFGEPREVYFDIPQQVLDNGVTVYDTEFQGWIEENYSLKNKRVTCYADIDGTEYARLKLNPLCRLQNIIYTLEKVEYNPSTRVAKLVLRGLSALPSYNQ